MSDRANRDRGRKRPLQRPECRWQCDCWYCTEGAVKVREMKDKSLRKDKLTKFASQQE